MSNNTFVYINSKLVMALLAITMTDCSDTIRSEMHRQGIDLDSEGDKPDGNTALQITNKYSSKNPPINSRRINDISPISPGVHGGNYSTRLCNDHNDKVGINHISTACNNTNPLIVINKNTESGISGSRDTVISFDNLLKEMYLFPVFRNNELFMEYYRKLECKEKKSSIFPFIRSLLSRKEDLYIDNHFFTVFCIQKDSNRDSKIGLSERIRLYHKAESIFENSILDEEEIFSAKIKRYMLGPLLISLILEEDHSFLLELDLEYVLLKEGLSQPLFEDYLKTLIISYFNDRLHASSIRQLKRFSRAELLDIYKTLENIVVDEGICSTKRIFDIIDYIRPITCIDYPLLFDFVEKEENMNPEYRSCYINTGSIDYDNSESYHIMSKHQYSSVFDKSRMKYTNIITSMGLYIYFSKEFYSLRDKDLDPLYEQIINYCGYLVFHKEIPVYFIKREIKYQAMAREEKVRVLLI